VSPATDEQQVDPSLHICHLDADKLNVIHKRVHEPLGPVYALLSVPASYLRLLRRHDQYADIKAIMTS
jgi:hypothetical protein